MNFPALLASLLTVGLTAASSEAAVITQWNFNGLPQTTPSVGSGTLSVIGGVAGSSAASTGSTDPVQTNGFAYNTATYPAASANNKSAGLEFVVNTSGYNNINVKFDQRNSATASKYWTLQYAIGSGSFTDVAGYSISPDSIFNNNIANTVSGAANAASVKFRIVSTFAPAGTAYVPTGSGSYAAAGTARFDMLTVSGNAFPTFAGAPYSVTVDVSPPGLETVPTLTSSAGDTDAADTVAVSATNVPSFLTFATTNGNPAGFTFTSNRGLTYADVGTYTVNLSATDSVGTPVTTTYTVNVVPEPTALAALALGGLMIRRRR